MKTACAILKSHHGFSIVEMLMTCLLLGLLSSVTGYFLGQGVSIFRMVHSRAAAVAQFNYAVDRILHRAAAMEDPETQISTATDTQLTFLHPTFGVLMYTYRAGENSDGTGNLYERIASGTDVLLAREVPSTFKFLYYKKGGVLDTGVTLTTDKTLVEYMEVALPISTEIGFGTTSIVKGTFLRNRYYANFL